MSAAPARRAVQWRDLLIAAAVYAVGMSVYVAWRAERSSDFRDFWENAVHLRETGQISAELGVHNYLPFFTLFMAPWGRLPLQAAIVLFTLLSLALFGVTVVLVHVLLRGRWEPVPDRATLATIALALPYVHSCVTLGQVGLLLLFLIVAGWFLVERGHEWHAGAALGLAALIKLLPLALLAFLLLKRRWRAAAAGCGVFLVLGLGAPLAVIGWTRTVSEHQRFFERAVRDGGAHATIHAEKPEKAMYGNNAFPIVLRRLLTPTDAYPQDGKPPFLVNVANLPLETVWWVYVALAGFVAAASLGATLRSSPRWPPDSPRAAETVRAQFGLWCCVMLLASPLVWTHYLSLAYWGVALLADRAQRESRRGGSRIAAVALLAWLLGIVLLAWPAARAAGAQLASVFVLWAALALLVLHNASRLRRTSGSP